MSETRTRRCFLRTASVAGAALATGPAALRGADGKVALAFVGVGHDHVMAAMYEAARTLSWVEVG
jgi:hypothetical protein